MNMLPVKPLVLSITCLIMVISAHVGFARTGNLPAWITSIGEESNDLLESGCLDVTLYNGWEGNAVDPDGIQDSTKALQKAIEDARDHALAAFFPTGTYKISDTLNCMKKAWWHERRKIWANWERRDTIVLIGSTKGPRPVIRLADKCPGFDNPEEPKAVVHIWNQFQRPAENPSPPPTSLSVKDRAWGAANGFDQLFSGIDIHLGSDNPGSVGLAFAGAQGSSIEDVKITAIGGFAGFWNLPGRAMGAANIQVEGGKYGIYIPQGCPSPVAVGVTLKNQTERAIHFAGWTPLTIVGFHIVKQANPVIESVHGWGDIGGTLVLVDGKIEVSEGEGPAIDNEAGKTLYMRNVHFSGTEQAIKSVEQPAIKCKGKWTHVREYAYCDRVSRQEHKSYNLIDGKLNQEEIASVDMDSSPPPYYLLSQHIWERLPSFEDLDAKNVRDSNIGAVGDGKADDTSALQKAIDQYKKVFLPKGTYKISSTLILHKDTQLFGLAKAHATIVTSEAWLPTEETPILMTVDDANATTYLANMNIGFNAQDIKHDLFNLVTWRAGRNSIVKSIEGRQMNAWETGPETTSHRLVVVTGNGGGRWYFWPQHSTLRYRNRHPDFRLMAIVGTREPLTFYGFNPEHSETSPQVEINGSQNVKIFAVKVENRRQDVIHIINSRNIMVVGYGGHSFVKDGHSIFRVKDSKDVILAVIGSSKYNKKGYTIYEENSDGKDHFITQDHVIALYKNGELNDHVE